jgi:hypothetical protein
MVDVLWSRHLDNYSAGIRVMAGYRDPETVVFTPIDKHGNPTGTYIWVPYEDIEEFIRALRITAAGPLGRLALEADACAEVTNTTVVRGENNGSTRG